MNSILVFDESGFGRGLYTEDIDLASIGQLQIERASTIEFDNATQTWIVRVHGDAVYANQSRAKCLRWEREYFGERI